MEKHCVERLRQTLNRINTLKNVCEKKRRVKRIRRLYPQTKKQHSLPVTAASNELFLEISLLNAVKADRKEIAGNGLSVTASKGQIHVMNPSAVYMERIRIYDMKGLMLEDYIVRDRGNAILATQVSMQVILVEIIVEGGNPVRFKILQP